MKSTANTHLARAKINKQLMSDVEQCVTVVQVVCMVHAVCDCGRCFEVNSDRYTTTVRINISLVFNSK